VKKARTWLLIGILVLIIVVGGGWLGLSTVDVASGWQLYAKLDSLTVNAKTAQASNNYQVSFDPDGALQLPTEGSLPPGDEPTAHAGISSAITRDLGAVPQTVVGYTLYRYRFGLDLKTIAAKLTATGIYYEADYGTVSASFTVGLQQGSLALEPPDAQIMDIGVDGYASGITAYPFYDAAQITTLFGLGVDPSKNVDPEVTTYTQANEGCIKSIDSARHVAGCGVTVKLRAGGIYTWSNIWGFWIATDVTVYDVYANYVIKVDVAVAEGSEPPATNPFEWLTIILTDLSIRVKDMWDHWVTEGLPLTLLIAAAVLVVVVLVVCCYFGGLHRRKGRH
jgi:hypothetical protein